MRWSEEVQLLQEEMRRVVVFLSHQATWWENQGSRRLDGSGEVLEGRLATARRQAAIRRAMRDRCLQLWQHVPELTTTIADGMASS